MKRRIQFASAGLAVYVFSLWVLDDDRLWLVASGTLVRLLVAMLPWRRSVRLWPLAFAVVYPYDLVLKTYAQRWEWAPDSLSMQLSGPTAFLIWMSGWLFVSILTAGLAVMKAAPAEVEEDLRTLSKWIFGVTAVGAVVSLPQLSMQIFHYAAEPLAVVGYCWVMAKDRLTTPAAGARSKFIIQE